ncbi:MAG: ribulokinase [Ruminococcaceae bacterium]|nr:ribulokinase [Oscillospiraceae bacterium]
MAKYTIGIDFGSLSGRAVLTDVENGQEVASATLDYPHAVMDTHLAATGAPLPPDFALQDPADYLLVLEKTIPQLLADSGVSPAEVVAIALDFTCCTLLPVDADGTPLCFDPTFSQEPLAYTLLWKHHAAQKYANRMNEIARQRGEKFLDQVGGVISSEWMFPKIYQVLAEAPAVYEAARYFIEAGDWVTWMLCGEQHRGYQYAAYKSLYVKGVGYPSRAYFAAVDPRLANVVADKLTEPDCMLGDKVGELTAEMAKRIGLCAGIAVGASAPDAHIAALALGVKKEGDMFGVLGTSGCFFLVGSEGKVVPGTCGTVADGVLPGLYGFESGLCCLGDHFAFAAEKLTSAAYQKEAETRGIPMIKLLIEKAAQKKPGESGVIALNWFNGNRSTLVNSDLSGLFVGMTLTTAPEDLMRALIEATAFGWRNIVDAYENCGVPVKQIIASGGIARKDPFTMQLYADVLGKEIAITETAQAPAASAAIGAAVAGGYYSDLIAASDRMASKKDRVFRPIPAHTAIYDRLYAEYKLLHDYFGKGGNDVMRRLRHLAAQQK